MASRWAYFREFLRAPGSIGAITPSSESLARAMADQIDFCSARVVLEYGPGTGVITRELLRRLSPDAQLVVIELHPDFHANLVRTLDDPRISLVLGSATDVRAHLDALGIDRVDAIVSALPFANMPPDVRDAILAESRAVMAASAPFVAVQYLPFALPPILRRRFRRAHIATWCARNVPPAFVMVAADSDLKRPPSTLVEAREPIALLAALAIGLGIYRRLLGALVALGIPLVLALYRDSARHGPSPLPPGAMLAPGEGRVISIGPGRDSTGADCVEIRIFLALWDLHVQRAPADTTVRRIIEQPGGFMPAFLSRAGDTNQRTTVLLEGEGFTCEVVQVAGILARRIVCWVKEGQRVRAGQRLGMIKFGSQVILRVPPELSILVREGQHVRVGEDVVAMRTSDPPAAPAAASAG